MKSFSKIGVVLLAALTLAAYSTNAQTAAPSTSTNHPAGSTARPRPKRFVGKVVSVDNDAKTVAITLSTGVSQTLHITSKTRIMKDGEPATLAEVTAGVSVFGNEHQDESENWVATTVNIGTPKPRAAARGTNTPPAAAEKPQ